MTKSIVDMTTAQRAYALAALSDTDLIAVGTCICFLEQAIENPIHNVLEVGGKLRDSFRPQRDLRPHLMRHFGVYQFRQDADVELKIAS